MHIRRHLESGEKHWTNRKATYGHMIWFGQIEGSQGRRTYKIGNGAKLSSSLYYIILSLPSISLSINIYIYIYILIYLYLAFTSFFIYLYLYPLYIILYSASPLQKVNLIFTLSPLHHKEEWISNSHSGTLLVTGIWILSKGPIG